jgi:cobaltochelatase CobT
MSRLRKAGDGVLRTFAASGLRVRQQNPPMSMRELPSSLRPDSLAHWRGQIDALALRACYSDAVLYEQRVPASAAARGLFWLLEQNRVEALGARSFFGVGANLAAVASARWTRARPETVIRAQGLEWIETFALLARIPLGAPMPEAARTATDRGWQAWMTGEQVHEVEKLVPYISRQDDFAIQSLSVIATVLGAAASNRISPLRQGASSDDQVAPGGRRGASAATPGLAPDGASRPVADPVLIAVPQTTRRYDVYTSAFDAIEEASALMNAATAARLRAALDQHLGHRASKIAHWASRLQRKLLALQAHAWQFDCEDGELDASRLTRVATHPLDPLAYKQDVAPNFPETVVTLLVDNSGSMRGPAIALAAVCAEVLARVLERCSVKTEILGFTTRSWRGGRAAQAWASAGRTPQPGRVAELRHLIYKRADEPWRRARPNLGGMLDDELLKENIDGEALLWAYDRLKIRPEPRKILVLICDGAPHDEATLGANGAAYLERHLRAVVERIERDGTVELAAVGIGHEAGASFRRAVTVGGLETLGEALVLQLLDLFDPKGKAP